MRFIPIPCLFAVLAAMSLKALAADENDAELIRSMQRQQHIDAGLVSDTDVRLEQESEKIAYILSEEETPCIRVNHFRLDDETERTFSFLPSALRKETAFENGMCLGSNNLDKLQKAAQQILISRGYLTSQALIRPQDMAGGILELHVSAGKTGSIRYEEKRGKEPAQGSISAFNNKFPLYKNQILNLRDVEQGLENLRRLPSVEADIQIMPSEEEEKSDLLVKWTQDKPVRFSIGIDDAGGKTTGKYQGNAALSFDNPLGLSDLFYQAAP
ncbi:hypothetical protein GJV52_02135 [Neisseria brasiliensis]|nr:ShlB/FhaC/HecB family hemolysin secretion/activation protein [Neisseria sp. N177_16]QGL24436.1 hypothetical protein GJV52_02135 [Neisseria brasiliensis]